MLEAVIEAALRTLVLAGVVQLGLWLLRVRQVPLLLIAWTVVLAASLAMPALQWATPRVPLLPNLPGAALIGIADPQSGPVLGADSPMPPSLWPWLEAGYLLVSGILLLRLAVGVALSLRLLAKAEPACLDWTADAHVRISRNIAAPVTVAHVILIPVDAARWPAAIRQAVLAHERAHVARWDFAMLLAAQVNRAIFWFSPLSWWLHRRLAVLAELASDDQALAITGDRSGYAEALLEMGRRSGPLLRGLAMARPSTLPARIERVLSGRGGPEPVSGIGRVMLAIGAAGLSIAAASPGINPVAPPGLDAGPSPAAQTAEDATEPPVPPQTKVALQAPLRSEAPTPPAVRVAAQPVPHPIARRPRPVTPPRPARQAKRSVDAPAADIVAVRYAVPSQPVMARPASEPPLLRQIDQQTCNGAYLPGPIGKGRLEWLEMVEAKFFRKADGTSWLTFHDGTQTPVDLPVTVTGTQLEFTGTGHTVFTMVPRGPNHLTGTTQRPYGTIDVACGASNARLFPQDS